MSKPNVFIGSASESIDVARDIEFNLQGDANVTIWDQGVFGVGTTVVGELGRIAEQQDFAVLVFTGDDRVESRGHTITAARDNVVFELGFFYGRLGSQRTIIVKPRSEVKIPSDLAGVLLAQYDSGRQEQRLALSPACTLIRDRLRQLGNLDRTRVSTRDPKELRLLRGELFVRWLKQEESELSALSRWLDGQDLPVGVNGEPHLWISTELGTVGPTLVDKFVNCLALLLETRPDARCEDGTSQRLCYNLLTLCMGLAQPAVLGEPLYAMLRRRQISGVYNGTDLRDLLTEALIRNQKDRALLSIWQAMLRGTQHDLLSGDVRTGFKGVAWMPQSEDAVDQPDVEALGWAIEKLAATLNPHQKRNEILAAEFHALVTHWGTWLRDYCFPRLAEAFLWPSWAISLIQQPLDAGDPPNQNPSEGPYIRVIAEFQHLINDATPQDRSRHIAACKSISEAVFEQWAGGSSHRDRLAHENHILIRIESEFLERGDQIAAAAIQRGRRSYMVERRIIPHLTEFSVGGQSR